MLRAVYSEPAEGNGGTSLASLGIKKCAITKKVTFYSTISEPKKQRKFEANFDLKYNPSYMVNEWLTSGAKPQEIITAEERLKNQKICLATTTLYPKWRAGDEVPISNTDQLRGNLALKTIKKAKENGFQIVVIDSGSSEEFKKALEKIGIKIINQEGKGMSAGRSQAFGEAANLSGVEIICWTEPEKISMVENLSAAAKPIFAGEADIVVPARTNESYATYPPYQAATERSANYWANKILRIIGLLPEGSPDLDLFFGPRLFRNTPEILELFQRQYQLKENSRLKDKVKPEDYLNAIFFPIMVALKNGLKVVSLPINYVHPKEQTDFETGHPEFEEKRRRQKHDIVRGLVHLARLLINKPQKPSELELVEGKKIKNPVNG